jgi:serine/threonine-protein kinase
MFFGAVFDPSAAQRARQLLEGMQADGASSRRRVYLHQVIAEGLAYEGKLDLALLSIERACDAGLIDRNWLEHCPLFTPLRAEPRFAKIVETVSARAARVLAELI